MLSLTFALLILFSLANAASILPYISNGQEARITEFPYLVSIQEVVVHVCTGSLLSERWVLSSARCFNNRILNELNIEYGNSEITPGPNGPNKVGISRIIRHEEYDSVSVVNDISLVEAETTIVTGFHDTFAKLAPGGSRFGSGVHSVHAGWGHIRSNQRTTSLQKASLKTLSFDECVLASADTRQPVRTNICAKAESVICLTDLGNPLLINGVLVGIASFRNGPTCESVEGKYPNVYTDVSYYINWIERHTSIGYELSLFLSRKS